MNAAESVDQDAVLRARTVLLGSSRLSYRQAADAYRVLAQVSPATHLPRLADGLLMVSYGADYRGRPEARLVVLEEAVAAARRVDEGERRRAELLIRVLGAYQSELCELGRRAEALAVCEQMASIARLEYQAGRTEGVRAGLEALAARLAEEGRHREAADLYAEVVQARGAEDERSGTGIWTAIEWAAELEAARAYAEAAEVVADLVARHRAALDEGRGSLADLVFVLVRFSQLLDAGGRRGEARSARREVLSVLAELAESGDRARHVGFRSLWVVLLVLGGRGDEPAALGAPAPPFGSHLHHGWSPDVRQRYLDGRSALRRELAVLAPLAESAPERHLLRMVTLQRRLTMRTAVETEVRTHQVLEQLMPLFDEAVALARRLVSVDIVQGSVALAGALTDRSTLLTLGGSHGEALADFVEATGLFG